MRVVPLFGSRLTRRGRSQNRPVRVAAAALRIERLEQRWLLSVSAPGLNWGVDAQNASTLRASAPSDNAQIDNVHSHMLAPLVVDVVTHGFNSSPAAGFTSLAKRLAALPAPHSKLDGRVGSEVFAWNSSS